MSDQGQTGSISEAQALGRRLATIMMPYAERRRIAWFEKKPGLTYARFVHYTTAEAALSIIRSKRFWMRNTNCMTDYREVQHGFDIFARFFVQPTKKQALTEALDACAPGVAAEAMKAFDQSWNDIRLNTYISSLSEHQDSEDEHGRLSMWRAFGGSSARVGIVLRVPSSLDASIALNVIFSPVAYFTEASAHAELDQVIANIRGHREFLCKVERSVLAGSVYMMLLAGIVCLKHQGFDEEREWRAIYAPRRSPSPLMESSTEVVGGIPQLVYKIPLDSSKAPAQLGDLDFARLFDRLIIGPTQYPWPMYEAFVGALASAGVADAPQRIARSDIPIRA